MLKFLHFYDPQNENEDTARAFLDFMASRKDTMAAGGDNIVKELYQQFKEKSNT